MLLVGAWTVDDRILVDPGPESAMPTLLAQLDGWQPEVIALTHIHLDHAGATGALLERWPEAKVWVHPNGARHLIDPSKLIASATRLYGDDMDRMWGRVLPVPEHAVRVPLDGETLGPMQAINTPGHANHHYAYLHRPSGVIFAGDVAGVRVAPAALVIPPAVPPEFDPEAWHASVARIRQLKPSRIMTTHFGAHDDVDRHLDAVDEAVRYWGGRARELDQDAFVEEMERAVEDAGDPGVREAYALGAQPAAVWVGVRRYWDKRAAPRSSASVAP